MSVRAAVTVLLIAIQSLAAQERPLPKEEQFLTAARENLTRASRVQDRYAYKERRTELHTNPFGRLGTGEVRVHEVTPVPSEPGVVAVDRRLLERDGKPVSGAEAERVERRRRRGRSPIEEAAAVMQFSVDRRERIDGRDVIVVKFSPKPGAKPETREGKIATVLTGTIWIDEASAEVLRAEATANDSVSYGLGVIARLHKGATLSLTRAQVDGNVWMPTSVRFNGEGRAIVFRKLIVNHVIEWFDYKLALPAS